MVVIGDVLSGDVPLELGLILRNCIFSTNTNSPFRLSSNWNVGVI